MIEVMGLGVISEKSQNALALEFAMIEKNDLMLEVAAEILDTREYEKLLMSRKKLLFSNQSTYPKDTMKMLRSVLRSDPSLVNDCDPDILRKYEVKPAKKAKTIKSTVNVRKPAIKKGDNNEIITFVEADRAQIDRKEIVNFRRVILVGLVWTALLAWKFL